MSWLFSRALAAEYSADTGSDGGPFAPLKQTPMPQALCVHDKTMRSFRRSRYGMTFGLLPESHGADLLTWYRAAFLARTSALPEKAQASPENEAGSGDIWRASFAKYDRSTSTWKTVQCSLLGDSDEFSETWPRSGSMRNGACYQRPTLARRTCENAYGLWPTIRSTDGERGCRGDLIQAERGNPNSHYRLWPTPTVNGNHNRAGISPKAGDGLATAIAQFPTPTATDHKGANTRAPGKDRPACDDDLPTRVQRMPTPSANDYKGSSKPGQRRGQLTDPAMGVIEPGGSLNPDWVEWLMGWPIGWTRLEPIEWRVEPWDSEPADIPRTARNVQSLRHRLRCIGNGQVPQCAATAFDLLTDGTR